MNISEWSIKRPVAAIILNALVLVVGVLSLSSLTIDEYPSIVVPKIRVSTTYPNADAYTVESEVTFVLEEALASLEGLYSIKSESTDQSSNLTLQFVNQIPMDRAMSDVRERITGVRGRLPKQVKEPMVERAHYGRHVLWIALESPQYDLADLTHFALLRVKNRLRSIAGVSDVQVMGPTYAMQISLDPERMHGLGVNPHDVVATLKAHEFELPAGSLQGVIPVSIKIAAQKSEEFGQLIVRQDNAQVVRLRDIADINLQPDQNNTRIRLNQEHAVILAIGKAPDGNLLELSKSVDGMITQINEESLGQVRLLKLYDAADFVRGSLKSMVSAIAEASFLVILIILIFLRTFRSALVPLVTIPISLIGTLACMKFFGCTINIITLLAMVLAIGLVVDDAIVVLENVFRFREKGEDAPNAARLGSSEISFAVVAMTCTLLSVYLPLLFVSDLSSVLFREFAITLACAIAISGFTALTLTPVMCAYFLGSKKQKGNNHEEGQRWFNKLKAFYAHYLPQILKRPRYLALGMAFLVCLAMWAFHRLPSDLLPKEDRGLVGVYSEPLPEHTLVEQEAYAERVEKSVADIPERAHMLTWIGSWGSNVSIFLKPWDRRAKSAEEVKNDCAEKAKEVPSLASFPWSFNSGLGFLKDESEGQESEVRLIIKSAGSYEELYALAESLKEKLEKDGRLEGIRHDLNMNQPTIQVLFDLPALAQLGISVNNVSLALNTMLDRLSTSSFRLDGQSYPVVLAASEKAESLNSIYVRSKLNDQIPLGALLEEQTVFRPSSLRHEGQMRQISLQGNLPKGQKLSDAKNYLRHFMEENIPTGFSATLSGVFKHHEDSFKTALVLFFAGLIFVYALMAIQFGSFWDPLIILFTVPLACIGAVYLLWAFGQELNLYTHLGFITLIGLITKHGILVVDFANKLLLSGRSLSESVIEASVRRFRPILMTTLAMVLGCLPLIFSKGVGFETRRSIGIVLLGGLCFGTLLTIFVLPTVYVAFKKLQMLAKRKMAEIL